MPDRSFVVRVLLDDRVSDALHFHEQHLSEYLWPRTKEDFENLAKEESICEVIETTGGSEELVGLCYVTAGEWPEDNSDRFEFGGIFILNSCRRLGLASTLGTVAIANHYVWNYRTTSLRLIAHVHESNNDPRDVLTKHLGFKQIGQETPPADKAPANLKRNDKGEVVGDLFEFQRKQLVKFGEWLEQFNGIITGKNGESAFKVDLPFARPPFKDDSVTALKQLGVG